MLNLLVEAGIFFKINSLTNSNLNRRIELVIQFFTRFVATGGIVWALILLFSCESNNPTSSQRLPTTTIINSQDIVADEVWKSNEIHVITAHITIQQAILKIEPGTLIKFGNGTGISVGDSAGLLARGTTNFIRFTSDTVEHGAWDYLKFSANCIDDSCELSNCIFEFGGNNAENPAQVICDSAAPLIRSCQFRRSASNGVLLRNDCRGIELFGNTFQDNAAAPLVTPANSVAFIGMNSYQNNGVNFIQVSDDKMEFDDIWYQQPVPLQFTRGLSVQQVTLQILPGNELRFDPGQSLTVSANGALQADATLAPIKFTALENSHWNGIIFEATANHAASSLIHCTIEKAGQNELYPANIVLRRAMPEILNCNILDSQQYGVYLDGEFLPDQFVANYFFNNRAGAICLPAVAVADLNSQFYGDPANDRIVIRGGPTELPITADSRWTNFGVDYKILDTIQITRSSLTIDPGTQLLMTENSGIEISQSGGLIADGSSNMISIRGEVAQPGYWDAIYLAPSARQENCKLIQCRIRDGGGNPVLPGMIFCDAVSPTIRSCFIENSGSYGIYLNGGASIADLNTNYFDGNIAGDYFIAP